MSNDNNLWPSFADVPDIITPLQILKEQAAFLESSTNNLLKAEIVPNSAEGTQVFTLRILAPLVGNYSFNLLKIEHGIMLYPLKGVFYMSNTGFKATDMEGFKQILKECFTHEETIRVIKSLISQSRSANKT